MTKTNYVLGFCFDTRGESVVLIKKNRPAWQAGKWNGIGGKIEPKESQIEAMVREFYEEAGVMTIPENWNYLGSMAGTDWACGIFYSTNDYIFRMASTQTDEEIMQFWAASLPETISNVPWLIRAALNHQANQDFELRVEYK
jgi:8-oxo-dGTP diphosphatase